MATQRIDHHYIGLDLGQRRDHTAIAALAATFDSQNGEHIRLLHLHRFPLGMAYTEVGGAVRRLTTCLPGNAPRTLAVDATGPGLPVVNMLREAQLPVRLLPAAITRSGNGDHPVKGVYSVARRGLLSRVRLAMETGKLRFPANYPLRAQFTDELRNVDIDNNSN
ncbi:MAG: hypothetical protein FJW30_29905, partial [Acidobacteria bacterium]|nr:hypothetical protein [Acidobacteriota bacterium]